jgi:cyclophilin family peptidyl-prolyl cis-trans isomerase/HEAT repeat protein
MVRGVIARTLGRLPDQDAAGLLRVETAILSVAGSPADPLDLDRFPAFQGAAKGWESFLRLNAKTFSPSQDTVARLKELVSGSLKKVKGDPSVIESAAFIRRLAFMALTAAKRLDESVCEQASDDPDEQVRRLALAGLGAIPPGSISGQTIDRQIRRGLQDSSAMVRYEALRVFGRTMTPSDLGPILAAVKDASNHVALLAVDLLGQKGSGRDEAVSLLQIIAKSSGANGSLEAAFPVVKTWHARAHALVSLAKIAPDSARTLLPAFVSSDAWPVRMYAARAAGVLKDGPTLELLTADAHDNVREAAISGLIALRGHEIDGILIDALDRPDYQLIQTAARGLKQSPAPNNALPALFAALARLTAQGRDTSRDPRSALLDRIEELGTVAQADQLAVYTGDFDPRIAETAAAILERWTGRKPEIRPNLRPIVSARLEDIVKYREATVRMTMAGNGVFELKLLVDEAPATVARFVALAKAGYYDDLTFHRVVPNFLIQGGSPGANEFMGDGPYLRDEVGLESHTRGAVGISTRGRDTGDAQICPDVVDNVRLDHDYTVFARVISGMEVVDRVLECDVIQKIEVIVGPGVK